jgi:hypothetical protein
MAEMNCLEVMKGIVSLDGFLGLRALSQHLCCDWQARLSEEPLQPYGMV